VRADRLTAALAAVALRGRVGLDELAGELQEACRCPSCNGAMALAFHRVIQCPQCETEVFL
jgi:Zn finger protein HypA/HybF involved in hydrogenase expression